MSISTLFLKPSKSGLAASKHPWIFDGAIDTGKSGKIEAGIVHLHRADGRFIATGTYNPKSAIAFRRLSDLQQPVDLDFFVERMRLARTLRTATMGAGTTGFRWVNSEGDRLPGLTIDTLSGHLAVQVGTPAMEALQPLWLEAVRQVFSPASVTRKDSQSVANREHMAGVSDVLLGAPPDEIEFTEAGIPFRASVLPGQKTGFFFDQRENRIRLAALSGGKRVLDAYAYTGGFGAHALHAGARFVTGVESSAPACGMMAGNYRLNSGDSDRFEIIQEDCLRYLKQTDRVFDVAILDPPALAKRRHHLSKAARLYHEIFAGGMKRISSEGGFLCACSCSAAVSMEILTDLLRQAADTSGRAVQIIGTSGAGADHPVSIHHPEGDYLKSVLVRVV